MGIWQLARPSDGVVQITLDKPPVNAPRFTEIAELDALLVKLASDATVRALVLTAAGRRAFVAGTDINDFVGLTPESTAANTAIVQRLLDRVYEFPTPVVCAVNGVALGFGLALAAACDIRVASTDAIVGLPEIDVGILGGSKHVARLVPQGAARLMMYTGWRIGAEEARRLGLVDGVSSPEDLLGEALRIAETIAQKFAPAVRLAKQGLNRTEDMSLREGYAYECSLSAELRAHPEAAAISRSFFERRKQPPSSAR